MALSSNPDANIASHVVAAVAGILAVLAAVHPGFKLPDNMTAADISGVIAGSIELMNTYFHKANAPKLAAVKVIAAQVKADTPKPLA